MNFILKYSSYVFHPLFIPFLGVCLYYYTSPKYYTSSYIDSRIIQLFILTVIIPLLIFRVLKKLGKASSIMMKNVKERRVPYAIGVLLNLYITFIIFKPSTELELHYFFAGISYTSITFLILSLINFKASLHTAAIGGLTMFIAALSMHFQTNLILILGILILINGLVVTSRLHLNAHNKIELLIGFVIGVLPQFIMMIYWV